MSTGADSFFLSASRARLCDCGGCRGLGAETPVEIFNRPGLKALTYRVGTHALFKRSMLARLSTAEHAELGKLNTRDDDDFSVALLDSWSLVADVLTFYQERVANESYLRTATERVSLLHLARLIGYELRPGVAASTYLAFTMEETPEVAPPAVPGLPVPEVTPAPARKASGVPGRTLIEAGTRVQSVPGPGELPQIFETVETVRARVEWNTIRPRLLRQHPDADTANTLLLRGVNTNLRQGDQLLLVSGTQQTFPKANAVRRVTLDQNRGVTKVDLEEGNPLPEEPAPSLLPGQFLQSPLPLSDAVVGQAVFGRKWQQGDLLALAAVQQWDLDELESAINRQVAKRTASSTLSVFAFRARGAVFGHNAPKYHSLPPNLRIGDYTPVVNSNKQITGYDYVYPPYPSNWEGETVYGDAFDQYLLLSPKYDFNNEKDIHLDNVYPGILKDSWVVLENAARQRMAYRVKQSVEVTRSDYALTAKVTRVRVFSNDSSLVDFRLRETKVLAQSEPLELASVPLTQPVSGNSLVLDRAYLGLQPGQALIISGERADLRGSDAAELLAVAQVTLEDGLTRLVFVEDLAHTYVRETVRINANVALATHGESKQEVLGSGDASRIFQRFALRQPPLTYVSAPTPSGAESTLEIRVNDVLWHEVPFLHGHGPGERVFITRGDDAGNTFVQFGDGKTGARLPTGQENVRASYRRGIGAGGLLPPDRLSVLLTRPLGLRGVTNPLPTEGGADPERREEVQRNAPLTMLTLDRIVSLRDYEDFARSYAGVAKALATWTWFGEKRGVFITVAGPGGAEIKVGGTLYKNLLSAMQKVSDPSIPARVRSYRPALFTLAAGVRIHPDYQAGLVLGQIEEVLRASLSFNARAFGQPVTLSEVVAMMHSVPGVVSLNVTKLYRTGTAPAATPPTHLLAAMPQAGAGEAQVLAAELLTLDPIPLSEVVAVS